MTRDTFVEQLVKVEYIEDQKAFGFYPFQMIAKDPEDKMTMVALMVGDIRDCYLQFVKQLQEGATTIYMAVDFPAGMDMARDMVCVHTYCKGDVSLLAIPYDYETGQVYDQVDKSWYLEKIQDQFTGFLKLYNF